MVNKSCVFKSCCSLHKHCSIQTGLYLFKGQGISLNKKAVYKLVCYLWCEFRIRTTKWCFYYRWIGDEKFLECKCMFNSVTITTSYSLQGFGSFLIGFFVCLFFAGLWWWWWLVGFFSFFYHIHWVRKPLCTSDGFAGVSGSCVTYYFMWTAPKE